MSCGEPDAQEWASPVRRAGRGNGPAATPAPRPGLTLRLRLAEPARLSILGGEPPELDQTRLLGVQLQGELRESFAQVRPEPLGVVPVLESHHGVVGETHDDHVTARVPSSPLVGPKVEDVVEVDVREQR